MVGAKAAVFDLDDTLYLEREYVASGFEHVAGVLGDACGIPAAQLLSCLTRLFEAGVHGDTFNRLFRMYPRLGERYLVSDAVDAYRCHAPKIALIPGMRDALESLRSRGMRLALITDGHAASQRAKLRALEFDGLFERHILTGDWGDEFSKPHPQAFATIMDAWGFDPAEHVYVADNPEKDFAAPNALGWRTIRLRLNGQLRCDAPNGLQGRRADIEVRSVKELTSALLGET